MTDKLPKRVLVLGLGTLGIAIYGVIACSAMILAFLGFGGAIAFSGNGLGGFFSGVGFGLFGALIALLGVGISVVKGFVGAMILNRQRFGYQLGLGFATLGLVLNAHEGAWMWAAWSVFALWALLTSAKAFNK